MNRRQHSRRHRPEEPARFESIASKIANTVRNTVRAIGAATRNAAWLTAATILALLLIV